MIVSSDFLVKVIIYYNVLKTQGNCEENEKGLHLQKFYVSNWKLELSSVSTAEMSV